MNYHIEMVLYRDGKPVVRTANAVVMPPPDTEDSSVTMLAAQETIYDERMLFVTLRGEARLTRPYIRENQ